MTRAGRRLGGLLLAAVLAPLLAADATAQELPPDGVRLEVSSLSPVLERDNTLHIGGLVSNLTQDDLRDLQLRLYVEPRVSTRSELQSRALDVEGQPRGSVTTVELGNGGSDDIGPQSSLDISVDIAPTKLRGLSDRASVHPLRIEVRGRVNRSSRESLGHVDTFIQWWPDTTAKSRLGWVWPLVETADRRADGVFADDDLAESVAVEGRLGELLGVAADAGVPLTWAVDPSLVANVDVMAQGYEVRDSDGVRDGEGQAAAGAWLTALDRALASTRTAVLALPYADPDLAALVRAGRGQVVSDALDRGREVLAKRAARVDRTLAWPPGGALQRDGLQVLTANGARTVVLAEESVETEGVGSFTPSAQLRLGERDADGVGLVADGAITRILGEGPGATGERLAVQRFLAETAMITLERPNTSRDIVVTPPRDWAPRAAYAKALLTLSGNVPWLEPATLPTIAQRDPDDVGRFAAYPDSAADAELAQSFLAALDAQRERVARFRAILPADESALPDALEEVLLRATSASWRRSPAGGQRLIQSVDSRVGDQFEKVRLSTGGLITLASETGRIPITIVNDLPYPVYVRVRVESRGRLILDDPARPADVVQPGRRQIDIAGRAVQAGEFTVELALLTPEGEVLPGSEEQLRVRSTAYGRVALVVVIGAFVVLVGASATRLVRRRRRGTEATAAPEAAPAG